MRQPTLEQVFEDLLAWCRRHNFAGYDPFDALNSRVFGSTPLKHSRWARLIWTQLFKRSPLNLRRIALVPPQKNAKGLALFALAALANYRRRKTIEAEMEARELLDQLCEMRIGGYHGAAWGYNFGWQSPHFFAPQGTPMIVPTAFAVRALLEAYDAFNDGDYLQTARNSCDFITQDLKRTAAGNEEVCFSYSPLDNTQIFNASLLAGETLAGVGIRTGAADLCDLALRAAAYVIHRQGEDGSWTYGLGPDQHWVDNFHTAYLLSSLSKIMKCSPEAAADLNLALQRGYEFWRERFFLADGWPKYYHDRLYPADAHAAATAIVTLLDLQNLDSGALPLAERIATWTIRRLGDTQGYFYYQRRRFYTIHTPYMRWTQGWMLYALGRLLEEKHLQRNQSLPATE